MRRRFRSLFGLLRLGILLLLCRPPDGHKERRAPGHLRGADAHHQKHQRFQYTRVRPAFPHHIEGMVRLHLLHRLDVGGVGQVFLELRVRTDLPPYILPPGARGLRRLPLTRGFLLRTAAEVEAHLRELDWRFEATVAVGRVVGLGTAVFFCVAAAKADHFQLQVVGEILQSEVGDGREVQAD